MKKNKIKNKGFTLVELLTVIAILAILASVVLSNLVNARTKSRDATRVTNIKQFQTALEIYRNKFGSYPTDLQSLVTNGYIGSQPIDPKGNDGSLCRVAVPGRTAGYCYAYNGASPTKYHLGAQLEITKDWSTKDAQFNSATVSPVPYTGGFDGSGTTGSAAYIYDVKF